MLDGCALPCPWAAGASPVPCLVSDRPLHSEHDRATDQQPTDDVGGPVRLVMDPFDRSERESGEREQPQWADRTRGLQHDGSGEWQEPDQDGCEHDVPTRIRVELAGERASRWSRALDEFPQQIADRERRDERQRVGGDQHSTAQARQTEQAGCDDREQRRTDHVDA